MLDVRPLSRLCRGRSILPGVRQWVHRSRLCVRPQLRLRANRGWGPPLPSLWRAT